MVNLGILLYAITFFSVLTYTLMYYNKDYHVQK